MLLKLIIFFYGYSLIKSAEDNEPVCTEEIVSVYHDDLSNTTHLFTGWSEECALLNLSVPFLWSRISWTGPQNWTYRKAYLTDLLFLESIQLKLQDFAVMGTTGSIARVPNNEAPFLLAYTSVRKEDNFFKYAVKNSWSRDLLDRERYINPQAYFSIPNSSAGDFFWFQGNLFLATAISENKPIGKIQNRGCDLAFYHIHINGSTVLALPSGNLSFPRVRNCKAPRILVDKNIVTIILTEYQRERLRETSMWYPGILTLTTVMKETADGRSFTSFSISFAFLTQVSGASGSKIDMGDGYNFVFYRQPDNRIFTIGSIYKARRKSSLSKSRNRERSITTNLRELIFHENSYHQIIPIKPESRNNLGIPSFPEIFPGTGMTLFEVKETKNSIDYWGETFRDVERENSLRKSNASNFIFPIYYFDLYIIMREEQKNVFFLNFSYSTKQDVDAFSMGGLFLKPCEVREKVCWNVVFFRENRRISYEISTKGAGTPFHHIQVLVSLDTVEIFFENGRGTMSKYFPDVITPRGFMFLANCVVLNGTSVTRFLDHSRPRELLGELSGESQHRNNFVFLALIISLPFLPFII